MSEFEFAARQSQQASSVADLSMLQQQSPMWKLFTMYKTSPLQYHRKFVNATRDLVWDHRNNWKENIKTMVIYQGVLPQLFQLVGNGFQWDGKDQLEALAWGNFVAIPIAGDAARGLYNSFYHRGYDYQMSPIAGTVDMGYDAIMNSKEGIEAIKEINNMSFSELWGYLDGAMKFAGHMTGTPVDAVHNTVAGVAEAIEGEASYPARRIIGWSSGRLEDDRYDLTRDLPADIRYLIEKAMEDDTKSFDELRKELDEPITFDDLIKD
jgi:hypothetical protein